MREDLSYALYRLLRQAHADMESVAIAWMYFIEVQQCQNIPSAFLHLGTNFVSFFCRCVGTVRFLGVQAPKRADLCSLDHLCLPISKKLLPKDIRSVFCVLVRYQHIAFIV